MDRCPAALLQLAMMAGLADCAAAVSPRNGDASDTPAYARASHDAARDGWQPCCVEGRIDACYCPPDAPAGWDAVDDTPPPLDAPDASVPLDAPDAPVPLDAPDAPDVPDVPDVPAPLDAPDAPDAPDAAVDASDAVDVPPRGTPYRCCQGSHITTCYCPEDANCTAEPFIACGTYTCILRRDAESRERSAGCVPDGGVDAASLPGCHWIFRCLSSGGPSGCYLARDYPRPPFNYGEDECADGTCVQIFGLQPPGCPYPTCSNPRPVCDAGR